MRKTDKFQFADENALDFLVDLTPCWNSNPSEVLQKYLFRCLYTERSTAVAVLFSFRRGNRLSRPSAVGAGYCRSRYCFGRSRGFVLPMASIGSLGKIPPMAECALHLSQKRCSFCLSKPQAWHIITTQSWISSAPLGLYLITRQRVSACGLMIYNASH